MIFQLEFFKKLPISKSIFKKSFIWWGSNIWNGWTWNTWFYIEKIDIHINFDNIFVIQGGWLSNFIKISSREISKHLLCSTIIINQTI